MFKTRNFITKYKNYLNTVKSLKLKLYDTSQHTELLDHVNNFTDKCRTSLSAIQNKFSSKCDSRKNVDFRIHDGLRIISRDRKTQFLAAGSLFSSQTPDVVSVTGYNGNDLEILQQLGIVPPNNDVTNTDNASSAVTTNNVSTTNASAAANNPIDVEYHQNYPHSSIFDNMPPESARNDLYTTFLNSFTPQNSHLSHDIALNQLKNDYLVVESPGKVLEMNENESMLATNELVNEPESLLIEPPSIDTIPEPPPIPDPAVELASQLNELGEQTFASLGLGGWGPVGLVQSAFEFLHVSCGLPWWGAIAAGTLVIRLCMFPLVIIAQRNAAKMNNYLPQMQVLQVKMTEARTSGNQLEAARYSQELMQFMHEKGVNPFKNMIVPLAQAPVFISFFVGLRQMANVPVDSLRTGGLFWFTDLTVPDQFFALPIITSLTLWLTIEIGTDTARLSSQNMHLMKYALRAMPVIILPFMVNFPGAILCYWVSSNFISMGQVAFLRIPVVRSYFNIDALVKHDHTKLPIKNKGFVGGMKESWTNLKIGKELEERKRLDELQFQRAGKGPLVKTYKYDPTKPHPTSKTPAPAISAKNR